nr:uncharacterized protein C18orf63-like [Nomia melanderi]
MINLKMDISNITLERKEDTILYISSPHINELYCIICENDFIEFRESSAKSNFHWQTLKCRLLIHLVSDVIASPILGTEKYIFVITHKMFFESGKLKQILKYLKLVYLGLKPVTDEVYKNCLFYTIQTKIAPRWNKVGQFLLQGKEFYNYVKSIRALKLNIRLQDKNVCLILHAKRVNTPYVKLEDYLPSSVVSQFLADPKGYIDLSYYNLPFVHVLPSMKRGKLLSVSKEIPPTCVFKDYNQMRRHWKNMYGYSLPKSNDGILYFEIKFPVPRLHTFIYPHICIISGSIDILPSRDKELIVTQFISDMLAKLPTICGNQLKISKHAFHDTSTLNTNTTSDGLLQNKQLITPLKRKYDPSSTMPLELSARYLAPDESRKDLTLKEKLLIAKSNDNIEIAPQEKDQYEDVEVMAKRNKLYMVKNSVLSMWLKEHSIPHNSKATKLDLINKNYEGITE